MKKSKHKTKKRADRQTKKKSRERATFDERILRHTFYIFFFSPLKGERKERRGRFDLHNNAQKHRRHARAKKKAFVDKTTHFSSPKRESL